MRGLLVNKPYETGINSFLGDTIELGVISPKLDTAIFLSFSGGPEFPDKKA